MNKVMVIAVHPDDETLGCGGTLVKHKKNGDSIYWMIITEMRKNLGFSREKIKERENEINKIKKLYGFEETFLIGIPTMQTDTIPKRYLVERILESIRRIKPDILYVPYLHDAHSDHKIVFEALSPCFKGFRYPFIKKILMMETVSETEYAFPVEQNGFSPNYFVDITEHIDKKLEAMNVYKSEIMEPPFPRSESVIKSLAEYRGSFIACKYAEAFMLIKEVW